MKATTKLNKEAEVIFKIVVKHLEEYSMDEDIYSDLATRYSIFTERANFHFQKGFKDGFVEHYDKGGSNSSGDYNVMCGFYKAADSIGEKLGLSPVSKEKIKAFNSKPVQVDSAFDKFKITYDKKKEA